MGDSTDLFASMSANAQTRRGGVKTAVFCIIGLICVLFLLSQCHYHQARNLGLKEDQAVTHELVVAFSKIGSYYLDSTQKAGTPLDTKIKGLNTALTQFELAAGLKNDDLGLRQRVIETLVQLGQTLVQADKLDEAIKTLEDALAKDPKQQPKWAGKISWAYFLRGMTHYRAGGFELAIADYEAGEKYEVTPDTNRSRLLAECQLGLQLLPRDPEGDKANAIAHLEKSLPLDPKLQEAVEKLTAKLLFVPKIKTNQDILDELAVEMKALYPEPANFQITIEIPPADAEAKVEAEIARDKINLQLDLARSTLGGVRIPKVIRDTYTPIIELGKVTPEAYFARGLAYRTLNMDKQAALDFKIAGVMSRLPRSEQITRSHYPYFEFVQGCERMLILEAKAKIIPPKKTKGVFELAEDVRAEIKRLEK